MSSSMAARQYATCLHAVCQRDCVCRSDGPVSGRLAPRRPNITVVPGRYAAARSVDEFGRRALPLCKTDYRALGRRNRKRRGERAITQRNGRETDWMGRCKGSCSAGNNEWRELCSSAHWHAKEHETKTVLLEPRSFSSSIRRTSLSVGGISITWQDNVME
jgi:hypothetical protein